jgi:hypothetical protein
MKARWIQGWKLIFALPLCGAYGVQGCTAEAMRDVAEVLEDQAREIDDDDIDFGDWLADEIEHW